MNWFELRFIPITLTTAYLLCLGPIGFGQELELSDAMTAKIDADFKRELEAKERDRKLKGNTFIMKLLAAGSENPEILEILELVEDQRIEVEQLVSEYKSREKEFISKFASQPNANKLVRSKMLPIREELKSKLFEMLVDYQLEGLAEMNVLSVGLPHVLTDTKVGDIVELSDMQKSRIRERSNDLAKRVEKFINESRREAHEIIYSELNTSQKRKLDSIYGKDVLAGYSRRLQMMTLFAHYRYFEGEAPKYPMTPVVQTNITEK